MNHETLLNLFIFVATTAAGYGALRAEIRSMKARLHTAELVLVQVRDVVLAIKMSCPVAKDGCPLMAPPLPAAPESGEDLAS